jgi:hypothetical protein
VSSLNRHPWLGCLSKPAHRFIRSLFNFDSYIFGFHRRLRLSKTPADTQLYIACVGHDYQHESKLLTGWMRKKHLTEDNSRVLVFSYEILPFLKKEFPVLYYRDIVSQAEELEYFAQAYRLVKELSSFIYPQKPEFAPFLAAIHHTWARDMFSLIVLKREIGQIYRQEERKTIAVVNMPWRTNNISFPPLTYTWKYDILNNSWSIHFLNLLHRIQAIVNTGNILFDQEQKSLRKLSSYYNEEESPRASNKESVLVLIEDSGTFINLTSAKAFIVEMQRRNLNPIVLTSTDFVVNELSKTGCRIYRVSQLFSWKENRDFMRVLAGLHMLFDAYIHERKAFLWDFFSAIAKPDIYSYLGATFRIKWAIERLCLQYSFSSAVTFGESNFLPAAAFGYLVSRNIRTIGIEGVMVMDHPTCEFWPAREHLAYGDQMVELLVKQGYPSDSIHVVGSEQFDRCQRRNKAEDIKYTREVFPQANGKKLLIVATEARARQMVEIEPSVKVLIKCPSLFTIIKVHPGEPPEPFFQLLQELGNPKNVVVVWKEVETLPIVHTADLLVTMGSNLVIEAGAMGVPTLVYNYSGAPCPIDFVKEGLCFGAYSVEEFERLVMGILGDDKLRKEAYNKLKYISRYNGPNDGQAVKRMVDFVLKHKEEKQL